MDFYRIAHSKNKNLAKEAIEAAERKAEEF
jgi:hypothetical protein